MNPLFFTLTFLTLIGVLTSSEVTSTAKAHAQGKMLKSAVTRQMTADNAMQKALFEGLSEEIGEKTGMKRTSPYERAKKPYAPNLNYNTSRPPNNSRLNFYAIIQEGDYFGYEVAARLIRNLYEKESYFTPHLEYRLLDALMAHKEEMEGFTYPDELAGIDFRDTELQSAFYAMLQESTSTPSLLNYITYDAMGSRNQKKVNLLFASPELLDAIFNDVTLCAQLEHLINEMWLNIVQEDNQKEISERLTRTKIRQELTRRFDELLGSVRLGNVEAKKFFDFTLGKKGNVVFVIDEQSGALTRKKIPPRRTKQGV